MRMLMTIALLAVAGVPAFAACDPTAWNHCETYGFAAPGGPDHGTAHYRTPASRGHGAHRTGDRLPRSGTLGGPSFLYPKNPTLGDSRLFRRTDPRRCTGLLCD